MPHAEREERKDRLRTKIAPGLVMEKALEPSDYIIDKVIDAVCLLFIIHVPTKESNAEFEALAALQEITPCEGHPRSRRYWIPPEIIC